MNAPFRQQEIAARAGTLHLFALFHLNLAFSSIEEEQRGEVIERCYWPLLDLAAMHGAIGIELTGFTLEEIAKRDPEWIGRLRALIGSGRVELIGSGYAQIIGPLVPAAVSEKNLEIGNAVYRRYLGLRPTLALVNEQAYAAGLVGLYLDAGYRAILMDWDNCAAHHPEWPAESRYRPQAALGADGRSIGLIWTNTVAFQKLQRLAHGDISQDDYLRHVRAQCGAGPRAYCFYASDAEIFGFRPGRYRSEEALGDSEWDRIAESLAALRSDADFALVAPSEILSLAQAREPLRLESAACPVPVKKQRKYNLSRWAVTGRDDIAINAACERLYRGLLARDASAQDWKELCYLWSSDFRTHITDRRWETYCARLAEAERRYSLAPAGGEGQGEGVARSASFIAGKTLLASPPHPTLSPRGGEGFFSDRHIDIETPTLSARLDRRRGLAIERLHFSGHERAAVGGLPHGHFDDIALQADWYTGDCVFEAPGEAKVTDLEWCEARISKGESGDVSVSTRIDTPNGPIDKVLHFHGAEPRVDFDLVFHWPQWGRGSLRLGHITLLPEAFDCAALSLTTHNGGKDAETFRLKDEDVDHGAPVSFLVSSSYGLGMTEGWAEIGDAQTRLRIEVDRNLAPLLGLLTHRRVGGSLFCQLVLSALELDETRKPCAYAHGPRRFHFAISAAPA
jgi:hypothetical protein